MLTGAADGGGKETGLQATGTVVTSAAPPAATMVLQPVVNLPEQELSSDRMGSASLLSFSQVSLLGEDGLEAHENQSTRAVPAEDRAAHAELEVFGATLDQDQGKEGTTVVALEMGLAHHDPPDEATVAVGQAGHLSGGADGAAQPDGPTGCCNDSAQASPAAFFDSMLTPIRPPLIPGAPARRRQARTKRTPATATRRSHRIQNRKLAYTGSGNRTLKQARRAIISKRGLALAEKGDDSDDEILCKYHHVFDEGLSPVQLSALTTLAKGAKGKAEKAGKKKAAKKTAAAL